MSVILFDYLSFLLSFNEFKYKRIFSIYYLNQARDKHVSYIFSVYQIFRVH